MARRRGASIARWFLAVHTALLFAGALVVFGLLALDARSSAEAHAAQESTDLAATVAAEALVIDTVTTAHAGATTDRDGTVAEASARLQPYAEQVMAATDIDYLTVMDTDRTRYTHRHSRQIGRPFIGTTAPALRGETFTEVYEGTLGPSVRAVVPVVSDDGEGVGMVSAGVTLDQLWDSIGPRLLIVGTGTLLAFGAGAAAAYLLARRLDRITASKGSEELARLFAAHEAVLHSVEEGLLLVEDGTVVLANDEALRLLGIPDLTAPFAMADGMLPDAVREVVAGRSGPAQDGPLRVGDRVLLVSRERATHSGGNLGEIVTLRDRTELQRVTGELSSVRTISEALRAQTHDFSNRLHTIATLIELGRTDEALGFAAAESALGQRLTDRVVQAIEEPVIAALVLGKAAQARERAVEMHFETHLAPGTHWLDPVDVVTILGNLIDNAIDAAAARGVPDEAWVEIYLASGDDGALVFQVSDSGAGIPEADRERVFGQGWSTKAATAAGRGYGLTLVRETVESLGGEIEVSDGAGLRGGAVLTVTIPRPAPPGPSAPAGAP
ncbi:sensor histidine kinase [Myceligenerans indicum]|uniref:histidine kinase n=1 Tax=Myceligenerans indicum TaxID=2593663 RepID=A0ABS1LID8_9MICO|nr:ATP-binding protein [Myceligenerans indicum]MBL0886005.1 GHKL domain-containing protein [Myceligenerans indicum]